MDVIGFDGVQHYLEANKDTVRQALAGYFGTYGPRTKKADPLVGYTGRYFDHYARQSAPFHFDGNDVAAVATLSVPLDGHQVAALTALGPELARLLVESPAPGIPLWEVGPEAIADDAPLSEVYRLLKTILGVDYVTASKLLASKRPDLVPVRDRQVEQILGAGDSWWAPWRELVANEEVRALVVEVTPPEVPEYVSILRRLDVILWMEASRRA